MSARLALRLLLGLAVGAAPVTALHAQPPAPATPRSVTNAPSIPPLPLMKSPVDSFRDLLAKSSAEREKFLSNRPPQIRRRILEKLGEYEAMKPDERELRLRMTQLRWYLLNLMQLPASEHARQLALVPEADRQLVGDRLQAWDRLPADEQKAVLKYEKAMEQFADQNLGSAADVKNAAGHVSPPARPDDLANLDAFLQLPPGQRQQMYASFQKFFELTDKEKQKTLGALPEAERQQMSGTMQNLTRLSPEERAQYLKAVSRFSSMSDTERREFMKNVEQWRQLLPAERQAWRSLVSHVAPQPPLPPGLAFPPMPPRVPLQVSLPNRTNTSP